VLFCLQFYLKSRLNCLLFTSKARPLHTLDGDDAMMEIPATLPVICSYFQFLFSWLALLGLLQLGHMFTDRCLFQYIQFYHSSSSLCGFFSPHCVFFSFHCIVFFFLVTCVKGADVTFTYYTLDLIPEKRTFEDNCCVFSRVRCRERRERVCVDLYSA